MQNSRQNQDEIIRDLKFRLTQLESQVGRFLPSIENTLRRQGFQYIADSPTAHVILPNPPMEPHLTDYFNYLRRYSFRILLRDIIKYKHRFQATDLLHYCSPRKVKRYLEFLLEKGIIAEVSPSVFQLQNRSVYSFGDTLEWYVAQIFQREFASPAAWAVRIANLNSAGDFDVVARVERQIVYVEVKSSPPKNIHQPVVSEFLSRVEELQPQLAIFFEDTHLRLEDKINPMFRWELQRRNYSVINEVDPVQRVRKGVFRAHQNLMIINSKPDIISNIRLCLRLHFQES